MIDKNQFDYTVHKIRQNRGLYQMSNELLAEEMLPYIQQILPQIRLVKCGIYQWYASDSKALKRLTIELMRMKSEKEQELEDINNAILQINQC